MPTMPFFVVPTALGTITANTETTSQPAVHLGEFDTIGMVWSVPIANVPLVYGDFGSAKDVDFVSLIGTTANSATRIRVRLGDAQADVTTGSAPYDSGRIAIRNPAITRPDGLYNSHLELASVQTRRWWSIEIDLNDVPFQAATLVLGKKVTPSNWYAPGFQYGVEDLGKFDISPYGVPDVTPGRVFRTLAFSLGWSSEAEFETKVRPLGELLGTRQPVFCCFDPTANTYRQQRSYMGWLRKPLVAQHQATTPDGPRFKTDFELLSMI